MPDDKMHSSVVQDWLKDLEGEAFKGENVLDQLNYENLRWEVKYQSQLKRKVILGEGVPQELEAIKEQILQRCGGLPLAATLIGGLLLNKGKEDWQFIVEESLLNGDQGDVKEIIKKLSQIGLGGLQMLEYQFYGTVQDFYVGVCKLTRCSENPST